MALITWRQNPPVADALVKGTADFEVEQALATLEQQQEGCIPLGEGDDPEKEAVTIKSHLSLAMPSAPLQKVEKNSFKKPTLWVNFLTLAGIQGPLPLVYTELLLQRLKLKDFAFRDFLDIFTHRLVSLWYKFRRTHKVGVAPVEPEHHPLGRTLLQLIGSPRSDLEPTSCSPLRSKVLLTYHDLLWRRSRSAAGLKCLLQSYFQIPVKIDPFQGRWQQPALGDLSIIGKQQGAYNALGQTMILGKRVWSQAAGIKILMGPLSWEDFQSFLPLKATPQSNFALLEGLCRVYTQDSIRVTTQLQLAEGQAKPVVLNRYSALGLNSWLTTSQKIPSGQDCFLSLGLKRD